MANTTAGTEAVLEGIDSRLGGAEDRISDGEDEINGSTAAEQPEEEGLDAGGRGCYTERHP